MLLFIDHAISISRCTLTIMTVSLFHKTLFYFLEFFLSFEYIKFWICDKSFDISFHLLSTIFWMRLNRPKLRREMMFPKKYFSLVSTPGHNQLNLRSLLLNHLVCVQSYVAVRIQYSERESFHALKTAEKNLWSLVFKRRILQFFS